MSTPLLMIRVTPKASRSRIEVDQAGSIRVYVTAVPEDGKANAAVCELVAKALKVPKSSVRVSQGHTSRDKGLELDSLDADSAKAMLREKFANPTLPLDPA